MPYAQTTLGDFIQQVSTMMDDPLARYWTTTEIQYATYEALRVFGAYTNYWRTRGEFSTDFFPGVPHDPEYDLSRVLPLIRTRTHTLDQMVREIQYMLLEAANGLSGAGMSGQVTVDSILKSIQDARNRFVLEARFPIDSSVNLNDDPGPVAGNVNITQNVVYIHRLQWMDSSTRMSYNLWRQDAWAADKSSVGWTVDPATPTMYSESEIAPLRVQLIPPPLNSGSLQGMCVRSKVMDLTNPNETFDVPDEWVHAIKYAALEALCSSESMIKDPVREKYAGMRYKQAVRIAQDAVSIIRVMVNGVPLNIDSLAALDAGDSNWRNSYGPPSVGGVLYDTLVITPGILDGACGVSVDVAKPAPLPGITEVMQIGQEDLDGLKKYIGHILSFKCGGQDFLSNMTDYDSFMANVQMRGNINVAKITNMQALFNQPQQEWANRPDRKMSDA